MEKIDCKKHGNAKKVAARLHQTLNKHAQNYFKDQNKQLFIENCRVSIEDVKPELNDLGWKRKL